MMINDREKNITVAVAGTGYVGLSIATLLSQHHKVYAVDIVPEKVELINNKKSPIQDEYIEKYLAEKDLDLTATLDAKEAYSNADFVVIAAPTDWTLLKYRKRYKNDGLMRRFYMLPVFFGIVYSRMC